MEEQVIDLLHKAVYAFATGAVADRLVEGPGREERMTPAPALPAGFRPRGAGPA